MTSRSRKISPKFTSELTIVDLFSHFIDLISMPTDGLSIILAAHTILFYILFNEYINNARSDKSSYTCIVISVRVLHFCKQIERRYIIFYALFSHAIVTSKNDFSYIMQD